MDSQAPHHPRSKTVRRLEAGAFVLLLALIGVWVWHHTPSALQQALFRDELRVALVAQPHGRTFADLSNGSGQFERTLLEEFAKRIGARLRVYAVPGPDEAYRMLRARRVDVAAGLLIAPSGEPGVEIGPQILPTHKELVYWQGLGRNINSLEELAPDHRVGATSPRVLYCDWFGSTSAVGSILGPELVPAADSMDLVAALRDGRLDYAWLTSIEVMRLRRQFPDLRTAVKLPDPFPVVWLFPEGYDGSLVGAAQLFLDRLHASREFERLVDHHFGHLDVHGLVDVISFTRFVNARLDRVRPLFEEFGPLHGIDWRFLAAISYQESHWDPEARSPTGVRGLMMLTESTARKLGIADRTDPVQSIDGGARYLLRLYGRLPESIQNPDRTWMALAAYNVGLGHLFDARRLAAAAGDDPDLWIDVMQWLPRLAQPEWHERTRHGYARGWEPVRYVQNIRSYYDWLVHLFPQPRDEADAPPLYLAVPLAL